MWRFVSSPFGLTLRGIRDSESRMRSLGYNVPLHLFIAFAYRAFSPVSPAALRLVQRLRRPRPCPRPSVAALLMAITGGIGTLFGSFVGAAAIIPLENIVSTFTARWQTVLGPSSSS